MYIGTAPLLIIVGVVLFNNVKRIDWTDMRKAIPAYCVLFFIPFTYRSLIDYYYTRSLTPSLTHQLTLH